MGLVFVFLSVQLLGLDEVSFLAGGAVDQRQPLLGCGDGGARLQGPTRTQFHAFPVASTQVNPNQPFIPKSNSFSSILFALVKVKEIFPVTICRPYRPF